MPRKRQKTTHQPIMDLAKNFQSFAWCKPDWCFPSMSKETNELLRQCAELPAPELADDVDQLIARSKAFPIPFPIETVRLEKLKVRRPIEKLKKNIVSTYPLIHERVLLLITHFIIYKREFGSNIEKELYKDMSVAQLIDRILQKRAVTFMGPADKYMLLSGEEGNLMKGLSRGEKLKLVRNKDYQSSEGWEAVGTVNQKPPLLLESCLSYDEMKLSAMVFVSGHTECINDGERKNSGVVREENAEQDAVIIGAIGPRFQRPFRMDFEDILVTAEQNVPENGYGEEVTPTTCLNVLKNTYVRNNTSAKHMWRQMWSEFYQVHSYTYEELTSYVTMGSSKDAASKYTERYVKLNKPGHVFDNEVYYKRISILAETVLIEADARAREADKMAYVNVVGCGLGVWKISKHQIDVYVLSVSERVRHLLRRDLLHHVSDVNFSYITPSDSILAMFPNTSGSGPHTAYKLFLENKRHPKGGINVQIKTREPSSKLTGEDEGKLLVMTYPWDSNAHPGNEFWMGSLKSSGDPAAASSTQVSELHNAHVNRCVCASATRVATPAGLTALPAHCTRLATFVRTANQPSQVMGRSLTMCFDKIIHCATLCTSNNTQPIMDFNSFAWYKPDWGFPSMSKETNELLRQCAELPAPELADDVDQLIARSKAFPIPFPIQTVRLLALKARRPRERLQKNIVSTYPLMHERVLLLMTHFLIYKREFGSNIEKELYKDMSVAQLIDRILQKRAVAFLTQADSYVLLSGERGDGGWEAVGTVNQKPPLLLESCLSYDEMKLSAMVFVSGHTECINDGNRFNSGSVHEKDIEEHAVIIGAIGPRFEMPSRMDCEDILVSAEQNVPERGYGDQASGAARPWRRMWEQFYQVPSYTYKKLTSDVMMGKNDDPEANYIDRFVKLKRSDDVFDNEVYYKRISILAETVLIEADARAREAGKMAYVNVIGCGLGVWKISRHQVDVYVMSVAERVRHLLDQDSLQHVSKVNLAYIAPSYSVLEMFTHSSGTGSKAVQKIFFEKKRHPNGGITVQIQKREPSSKLTGEDEGKLLVMTYPWDSNAHPGNEFWSGSTTGSGDPAAASSTQVSELHNAHVNRCVCASATRVATPAGLTALPAHCTRLAT